MSKEKRKKYRTPKVTKIDLDAKCAVLGFCKTSGDGGPGVGECGCPGAPCFSCGS